METTYVSFNELIEFLSTPLWILFPNDFTESDCKMSTAFNKLLLRKATKKDFKLLKNYEKENKQRYSSFN